MRLGQRVAALGSGGRAVTVYAQHEVLEDLIARRLADGGDVRFEATDAAVGDVTSEQPTVRFTHEGRQHRLDCDFVIGCDGSRTHTRFLIPEGEIRTDAPPSSDELIYAHSDRGFARPR